MNVTLYLFYQVESHIHWYVRINCAGRVWYVRRLGWERTWWRGTGGALGGRARAGWPGARWGIGATPRSFRRRTGDE